MALVPGSRVGSYDIVSKLGEGGMGEVYRARDGRLQRDVAIKILPSTLASDPVHVERFQREARAIAALTHPNIVTIHSVEEVDGVHFLTMELIEGHALDYERPADGCALPALLEIGMSLADALSAAHERGIVHRDLKPANVMVDRHGRVKILDFGLAKATGGHLDALDETRAPLTHTGLIVGTMPYMAPEQIEGRPVDARTDIFALGIVLYELATGERPFSGGSSAMLMTAILRDAPQAIAERRADLPDAFGRLVSRCLEKRPNDRIQTARDVYNELKTQQRELVTPSAPRPAPPSLVTSGRSTPSSGERRAAGLWTAVLPFTARGNDADTIALAEGLSEDITSGLIKFPYLKIVAASTPERPPGARYVVQGSLRRAGTILRVTAELIDSESGVHLWADRFDREFSPSRIFEIQDDLAARVIVNVGDSNGALVRALAATVRDRELSSLTVDELIWRTFAADRRGDPTENATLVDALDAALVREPAHAEGWACLAWLCGRAHLNPMVAVTDAVARQRAAAHRAIDIDPANQRGWCELATAAFYDRDEAGFKAAADRALALNPLDANIMAFLSHLIAYTGDWSRGVDILERTMALGGQHPGWYHYMPFANHFRLGEYEKAWDAIKRVNMAEYPWTLISLAAVAARLERWDDVRSSVATIRRVAPWFLEPDNATASLRQMLWDEGIVADRAAAYRDALSYAERGNTTRPPSSSSTRRAGAQPSIAVLPFANLSADPENEYFGDGLAEDILNALSGIKGLSVTARTSAFAFKGKSDDVRKIGEALHVGTVLEGSVRRAGGRVRVTAQLVDTTSGTHLWSDRYDRDITDIFAVQDDIAQAIVDTLKVTLTGAAPATQPSKNIEAYDAYLKGRHHLLTLTHKGVETAQQLFEQAIAADAGYAPAHADLAGCFVHYTEQGRKSPRQAMPHARELAMRAIGLDPSSPDGHHWLARVAAEYDYDWPAALHHHALATASGRLAPGARGALAQFVLLPLGRYDEAQREAEAAVAADPLSSLPRIHLANVYRARGAVDRALTTIDTVDGHVRSMSQGLSYSALGRIDDAIGAFERALAGSTAVPFIALGLLAGNLARSRQDARARETLARLDGPEHSFTRTIGHACRHMAAEEFEQAVDCLLQALAERSPWVPAMMILHPRFRQDPSARRLLDALRIPHDPQAMTGGS